MSMPTNPDKRGHAMDHDHPEGHGRPGKTGQQKESWDPDNSRQREQSGLQADDDHPAGGRRFVPAGGGVVVRRKGSFVQVLLILRRGLWDLPKGKIEPDESPESGALREVEEETGCRELRITADLGTTVHEYEEDGSMVLKRTWWYAMESGRPDLTPQYEEEIEALEWVDLPGASEKVAFDNLRTVLRRLKGTLPPG
jgi:8-oxo-dGTP pyrophosphatase MutT (NUDIX family)